MPSSPPLGWQKELAREEEPWDVKHVSRLVRCAKQLREDAVSKGRPELVLEVIQLERAILAIEDPEVRGALQLRVRGYDFETIDAAHFFERPSFQLARRGMQLIAQRELERAAWWGSRR